MEELLIATIQFLIEILLQGGFDLPLDWRLSKKEAQHGTGNSGGWLLMAFGLGLGTALIANWVFPYTWIKSSNLRIAYLVLSPIASAACLWLVATLTGWARKRWANSRFHILSAFWFAAGFALIRFAYAKHP